MGMANSVREIVKERAIYRRERAIGLSRTAYLAAKVVVLTMVTAVQSVVFTTIGILGHEPRHAVVLGSPLLELIVAVTVISLSSAMIGLVISALVDNSDKAMPLLVLITMSQVMFSGGLVAVHGKRGLEEISALAPARWGFAAVASAADLNNVQKRGDPQLNPDSIADPQWAHTAAVYLADPRVPDSRHPRGDHYGAVAPADGSEDRAPEIPPDPRRLAIEFSRSAVTRTRPAASQRPAGQRRHDHCSSASPAAQ